MDGWGTNKIITVWSCVIVFALVVGMFFGMAVRMDNENSTRQLELCLDAGNTVAECQVALN